MYAAKDVQIIKIVSKFHFITVLKYFKPNDQERIKNFSTFVY